MIKVFNLLLKDIKESFLNNFPGNFLLAIICLTIL